jgi:hypothetical protein
MLVLMLPPVGVVLLMWLHQLSISSFVVVVFIPYIMITWCVGRLGGGVFFMYVGMFGLGCKK